MSIKIQGTGGSIKLTGAGGSISLGASGGGGGGGGGSPINPSSRGDLKLRFLGGNYTPPSNGWDAISPGSTLARVYDASGNSLYNAGAPSFNGNVSVYMDGFTANNYDHGAFLDVPGGSTARTLYMVAHVPNINAGANPTRMFGYGSFNSSFSTVGFVLSDGYIYGTAEKLGPLPMGLVGAGASTKGAPISSATSFVVSYSYAAGSDLKDNPIYVNGVLGTYGAGTSGVISSYDNGSGITGGYDPNLAFQHKYGYGYDPSTSNGAPFYVADLLIFNTEHDSSTRAGVESWLMTQYGIS